MNRGLLRRSEQDPASGAWRHYLAAQDFKLTPSATFEGVNYARVLAFYLYDSSLRGVIKKLVFATLFAPRVSARGGSGDLSFYSFRYKNRADYDYMFGMVTAVSGLDEQVVESRERLSISQVWRTLRRFGDGTRVARGYRTHLLDRIAIALLAAKFISLRALLAEPLVLGKRRVFTFCDAAPHDNLVAQVAAIVGATTVTAQHGQYRILDETNMSSDAEAYANFVSDRMMSWGGATASEFSKMGIDGSRMRTTGWIRQWPDVQSAHPPTGVFGVMLNGVNGADSNLRLIEVAAQLAEALDMRYVLRAHPSFAPPEYMDAAGPRCGRLAPIPTGQYVAEVDFSISHSSSAAIEMLRVDSPVYILDDGALVSVFKHEGLSYKGTVEMLDAIRADRGDTGASARRVRGLMKWFNEDDDQQARIRDALTWGGDSE